MRSRGISPPHVYRAAGNLITRKNQRTRVHRSRRRPVRCAARFHPPLSASRARARGLTLRVKTSAICTEYRVEPNEPLQIESSRNTACARDVFPRAASRPRARFPLMAIRFYYLALRERRSRSGSRSGVRFIFTRLGYFFFLWSRTRYGVAATLPSRLLFPAAVLRFWQGKDLSHASSARARTHARTESYVNARARSDMCARLEERAEQRPSGPIPYNKPINTPVVPVEEETRKKKGGAGQ